MFRVVRLATLLILATLGLNAQAVTAVPASAISNYKSAVMIGVQSIPFVCSRVDLSAATIEAGILGAQQVLTDNVPGQASIVFIYKPDLYLEAMTGSEQSIGIILQPDGKTIREISWMAFDPPGPYRGPGGHTYVSPGLAIRGVGSCVPARKP